MGAQRPAQFAKYLPEFGWRAIVICCDSRLRLSADHSDLSEIARQAKAVFSNSGKHTSVIVPTPSLRSHGFLDQWWRLSLAANGKVNKFLRKALTAAKFLKGDYSQSWQPCAIGAADLIAHETDIDVCIGEHGPDAGIFLARQFSKKHGIPWIADFRDPILQPLHPFARRIYSPVAKYLLRTASFTVNVTPFWTHFDQTTFRRPATTIPNGFDPEEFNTPIHKPRSNRLTIAYTGGVKPTQKLEIFFQGYSMAKRCSSGDGSSPLFFIYRGVSSKEVARMAAEFDLLDAVDIKPQVSRELAIHHLRLADALLLLSVAEPDKEDVYFSRGFYPGKVFEYFGAGKPILCVPGDSDLLDNLIAETRTGYILRTPEQVSSLLLTLLREWKATNVIRFSPDKGEVYKYTRRLLTGRLAAILNGLKAPHYISGD